MTNFYSCYNEKFMGWFKADTVKDALALAKEYNQQHETKILRIKKHQPSKFFEVDEK